VLGRELGQLMHACVTGGEQRADHGTTFVRDEIAVGSRDFLDQTVRPELARFLDIAFGSASELEYLVHLCGELELLKKILLAMGLPADSPQPTPSRWATQQQLFDAA